MTAKNNNVSINDDKFYDYPDKPVPMDKKRSRINIAVVTTGMAVAMSTLYTGSALAAVLSYQDAVISIIIGCLILAIIASLTGTIGARKGLSLSMLARNPFGIKGSYIVGFVFAISMLGWFSYQCGYFGDTMNLILPGYFFTKPMIATFWGGILMMSTAIIGYKGMTYLSIVAAPLLLIMCGFGGIEAIRKIGFTEILANVPENPSTLGVGITIVIGGWITGAVLQPDISRFAKTGKDNVIGVVLAMVVFGIANWCGLIIAKATQAANILDGFKALGLGTVIFLIVVLGQWTSNDNNLYSAALAIINARPGTNKHIVSAICGVIFTFIAITGIQNYFVNFLTILGTFLPPFGAVMIADYFILKRGNTYQYGNQVHYDNFKPAAFISALVGGAAAYFIPIGSTAIFSIIITLVVYVALEKIMKK